MASRGQYRIPRASGTGGGLRELGRGAIIAGRKKLAFSLYVGNPGSGAAARLLLRGGGVMERFRCWERDWTGGPVGLMDFVRAGLRNDGGLTERVRAARSSKDG